MANMCSPLETPASRKLPPQGGGTRSNEIHLVSSRTNWIDSLLPSLTVTIDSRAILLEDKLSILSSTLESPVKVILVRPTLHLSSRSSIPKTTVVPSGPSAEPAFSTLNVPSVARCNVVVWPGISLTHVPETVLRVGTNCGSPHEARTNSKKRIYLDGERVSLVDRMLAGKSGARVSSRLETRSGVMDH